MFSSPFGQKEEHLIPSDCEVVVVADLFAEDYLGGAELTTEALIKASPFKIHKVHSRDVTMKTLESGYNKFWIFTNFSSMDVQLLPSVVANLKYTVVEYDYKFCRYRSIEKHASIEMKECDCHNDMHGKIISAFFHGARTVFYMSEDQMQRYHDRFPFLADEAEGSKQHVLSSVFDDEFFVTIKELRKEYEDYDRSGWLVLGSSSWIKGTQAAIDWCKENGKEYKLLQGMNHPQVLEEMAKAEGFVYLPLGGDTCPRMVIEAQLLGCQLHINDNVQHQKEIPFCENNIEDIEIYLYGSRELFWNWTKKDMEHNPNISGYTTTYNCISQEYPFKDSINSMLEFCKEVVVMDGGSDDGTWEALLEMSQANDAIKLFQYPIDFNHKRFAVQDCLQKARARAKCQYEFCWQQDSDERVSKFAAAKIPTLCQQFPRFIDIVALPVVEFWGSKGKIRMDVTPWKWRISRNKPHITHGIPKELRQTDDAGDVYSLPGTDGCDYVNAENFERIPHASFYTQDAHTARVAALQGNTEAYKDYSEWFERVVNLMPFVYHYSWTDIARKIRTYKGYWQQHWESLYDVKQEDTAENNMFFDKPWSEVTEEEIVATAERLENELGGHVFHTKVDWSKPNPHLEIKINEDEDSNQ